MINIFKMNKMKKGYGKSRPAMLPSVYIKPTEDKQSQLMLEMKKIDEILKADHLKSLHGLIFTDKLKNRLADDLLSCINKQHRLISFGFDLWGQQSEKIKAPLYMPSFKKKLEEISALNIEKFDEQKIRVREERKWNITPIQSKTPQNKRKLLRVSQKKASNMTTIENESHSTATTPQKIKQRRIIKVITQPQEEQSMSPKEVLTVQRIQRVLQKVEQNLITLWLPPKSYPQFYGIIVPSITVTKSSTIRCRLKKYILFKQSLNARLFQAILEYLSSKFDKKIERLELIVSRQQFRNYFDGLGCKIESWEGFDKVSVSYARELFS